MPVFDGPNKRIILDAPTASVLDVSVEVDLYSDWKEWVIGKRQFDSIDGINGTTERITITNHSFYTGQKVTYDQNGGTQNVGLTNGASYFVRVIDINTIELYDTKVNAEGSPSTTGRIDLTAGGDAFINDVVLALRYEGTDGSTTFIDESPAARVPTVIGDAQIDTANFKEGSSSGLFDGANDWLEYADSPDFHIGANEAFTLETWFYIPFNTFANNTFFGQFEITGNQRSFQMGHNSAEQVYFFYSIDGVATLTLIGTTALSLATWHHAAINRDTAGNLHLFVNGVSEASAVNASAFFDSSAVLEVGAADGGVNDYWGHMDLTRLTIGSERYPDGTTFTPPVDFGGGSEFHILSGDNSKFDPVFGLSEGGAPLTPGVESGAYFFLRNDLGWRIISSDEDQTINYQGNLVGQDATASLIVPTPTRTVLHLGLQPVTQRVDEILTTGQKADYNGGVFIDTFSGTPGTTYPSGTDFAPVNTWDDAYTIAIANGFRKIFLIGVITLNQPVQFWRFEGRAAIAEINIGGQDCSGAEFFGCGVSGTLPILTQRMVIQNGRISPPGLFNFLGVMANSVLNDSISLQAGDVDLTLIIREIW
jgi:hypothetical protein